ncbi:MAG: FG-GAP repeat protein [Phycisphaerales bacterium]|nr:MAG: FG-GAP repeat protein [Phycisphaerales bacterium]
MFKKQTATVSCARLSVGILRDRLLMSSTVPIAFVALLLAVAPGQAWGQCQADESIRLTALIPTVNEAFGFSVATSGDVAIIGAPAAGLPLGGGSAYVLRYDGGNWVTEAQLFSLDNVPDDELGNAVAISGDTAVVAAHFDDDACPEDHNCDSGSVYVFQREGTQWGQVAKLTASDALMWDNFGRSVAIDGDTIVVGANLDDGTDYNTGSAYVFTKPPGGWSDMTETCKLTPAGPEAWQDEFGVSVSISGNTILVGSQYDDDACPEYLYCDSGSAYVFESDGFAWTQVAKLTASDAAVRDELGVSVSIKGDVALVGAWKDDDVVDESGSVYVFAKPVGGWSDMTESTKLTAWDPAAEETFGWSVSFNGDLAVIGAPARLITGIGPGRAYAFQYSGGSWTGKLKLVSSDGVENGRFGHSVAVTDQGWGLIGAPYHRTDGPMNAGSTYVFHALTECDDSLFCNGMESCIDGICRADFDPCPGQDCDEVNEVCIPLICDDDGVCEAGENCYNCPNDCFNGGARPVCGDGICQPSVGEDCLSCPFDCNGNQAGPPKDQFCCGDGDGNNPVGCEAQLCTTDPWSCAEPVYPYCCGDGMCEGDENSSNCFIDCGPAPYCGDGACNGDENQCSCPGDCGTPPGSEVPGSTCFDGTDNDCDGNPDCVDTDCYGIDPNCPDCLLLGEPCTTDTECCSGDCHPSKNTCR